MNKTAYLDALKRALAGLPPDIVARTLAYYEQRYVDGAAAGLSDEEISADLDAPSKIAMTLRANAHLEQLRVPARPANPLRVLLSAFGLLILNLFMVIPGAVLFALLVALYSSAGGTYAAGIAVTASGLAGTNEMVLGSPRERVTVNGVEVDGGQTRITFGPRGVAIMDDDPVVADDAEDDPTLLRRAEEVADHGLRIYTDLDARARTTQALAGLALVLVGIALALLSIVVTRYVMLGARRYIEMNISLLKGA